MRQGFEDRMRKFSKLTKGEVDKKDTEPVYREAPAKKGVRGKGQELVRAGVASREIDTMEKKIDLVVKRSAEALKTDIEAQLKVYEIQKAKQEVMARLKTRLREIDGEGEPVARGEGTRVASFMPNGEKLLYRDDKGKKQEATFGEVLTDVEWGVEYALDKSAPRHLRKAYEIALAKHELRGLLDDQILHSEVRASDVDRLKRETYGRIIEDRESGVVETKAGFVAEKMVKNLLKKGVIDQDLPFEVIDVDVQQDVADTIDFIVHRTERTRGVSVEAEELPDDVGIQFSINTEREEKKREQVDRARERLTEDSPVDDILSVVMPLRFAHRALEEWKEKGRPAGGPDKLLKRDTAREVFENVLGGVLPKEELEASWKKIEKNFLAGRNEPGRRDRSR